MWKRRKAGKRVERKYFNVTTEFMNTEEYQTKQ